VNVLRHKNNFILLITGISGFKQDDLLDFIRLSIHGVKFDFLPDDNRKELVLIFDKAVSDEDFGFIRGAMLMIEYYDNVEY